MTRYLALFLMTIMLPLFTYANITNAPDIELHKSFNFDANSQRKFKNPLFFEAKVHCTLETRQKAAIEIDVLSHGVSINGQQFHAGQSTTIHGIDHTAYYIKADRNAKASVANIGSTPFTINCHL